jgi:hypothetical protein
MDNTKNMDVKSKGKANGNGQIQGQTPLISKWKSESSGESATNLSLTGYVRLKDVERDLVNLLRTVDTVDQIKKGLGIT